uniref:NADH dehydrogenase subunit 6 n=1 Tax=Alloeorhynchus sp. TaxID=2931281 RepID=A0A8T9ZXP3_9HEMI|nr:NADH dehydrogenase subunit 6 [Alloeorhynchus sp.]
MFLMFMLICTSIILPALQHPLSMGLILIIQTLLIAVHTGSMINMFWFSYVLVLAMLSGALVLFIYMASIASNEKFKMSNMIAFMVAISVILSALMQILMDKILSNNIMFNVNNLFINYEQMNTMVKLFNMQAMLMTLILVLYLLFSMISVSFIVNIFEGPMRSKS